MQRTLKLLFTAIFPLILLLAGTWIYHHTAVQDAYFTSAGYLYKILYFGILAGFIYWFCQRKYVKKDLGMLIAPCIYLLFVSLPGGILRDLGGVIYEIYLNLFPGYAVAMVLFFTYLYKTIITAIRATK